MVATLRIEDQLEIPMDIRSLADFRRWAVSESFPQRGRIDYLADSIEVDMSPEDLHTHGKLKVELVRVLAECVRRLDLGELYSDRTRVSCPDVNVSAEPDIVLVANESLDSGRVRLVPRAGASGYGPAPASPDGFQYSAVLDRWYQLHRTRNRHGRIAFELRERDRPT
jgi:hypothetical protein